MFAVIVNYASESQNIIKIMSQVENDLFLDFLFCNKSFLLFQTRDPDKIASNHSFSLVRCGQMLHISDSIMKYFLSLHKTKAMYKTLIAMG